MRPETIYLAVACYPPIAANENGRYKCMHNRAYKLAHECIEAVRRFTLENRAAIGVIVRFTVESGLAVEASYISGHTDPLHTIGVRECQSVYMPCLLEPITQYLDTVCRANQEETGHNG